MTEFGQQIIDLVWLWTTALGVLLALLTFARALSGSDWAPLLVMATVPVQRELLVGYGDTHLTYTQVAIAAFFAGSMVRFMAGQLTIRIDAVTVAFGTVVGLYGVSVIFADAIGDWAGETYRWFVAGAFLAVARSYFTGGSPMRIARVLVAGAGVVGIWAVGQVVFESGPPSFVRSGLMRAYGSFGEPNPFAALAWAIMLPLLACCVIAGESRIARIAAGIGAIVGLVVLGLTQSRGGFLGAAAGIAVIGGAVVLNQSVRLRQTAGIALALGTAAVISTAVVAAPWDDTGDQTTSANWADQERTAHWLAATQMIEEHPIFGVGAGDFSDEYRSATTNWRFRVSRGHAHNAYLQVAAEAGIPAVLAYIWLLAGISPSLIRRATPDRRQWLPIGVLGVTAALATHQVVDYLHVLSLGILFAGLWAAALAVGQEGLSPREHNFVA